MIEESGFSNVKVIATGGLGGMISKETDCIDIYDADLTLKGQNGVVTGGFESANGGGIYNEGTLTMQGIIVKGNQVDSSDTTLRGGGVYNAGTLTMTDCVITDNASPDGGGFANAEYATATLKNVTVSGNSTSTYGGGGILNYGTLSLENVEIQNNTAATNGAGLWNNDILYVKGKIIVKDNKSEKGTDNLHLTQGKVVTIAGKLTEGSEICENSEEKLSGRRACSSGQEASTSVRHEDAAVAESEWRSLRSTPEGRPLRRRVFAYRVGAKHDRK